jgi:hypothetical protein
VFKVLGNPNQPILQQIQEHFIQWLKKKGVIDDREMGIGTPLERLNKETFSKLIQKWLEIGRKKSLQFIDSGIGKYWKLDRVEKKGYIIDERSTLTTI